MLLGHPGFAALELSGPRDHESPPLQVRGLVVVAAGGGSRVFACTCLSVNMHAHVRPSLQSYRSAKSGPTHAPTAAPIIAAAPMFDSGELLPSESQWHPATAAAPPPPSSRRPPAAAPASARAPPPSVGGTAGGHSRGGGASGGAAAPPRHAAAPVPPQHSHLQQHQHHHPPATSSSAKGHQHPRTAAAAPFSVRPVVGPSAAGASSGSHGPGPGQAALAHPHRLEYAKMWINALGVADPPLPVEEGVPIGERFKSGTLLCAVLEAVGETARLG